MQNIFLYGFLILTSVATIYNNRFSMIFVTVFTISYTCHLFSPQVEVLLLIATVIFNSNVDSKSRILAIASIINYIFVASICFVALGVWIEVVAYKDKATVADSIAFLLQNQTLNFLLLSQIVFGILTILKNKISKTSVVIAEIS